VQTGAPFDLEIREQLDRYLAGDQSLGEFREWFIPRCWDVLDGGEDRLQELVYDVELRLAEFTNGQWTEAGLKELFQPLLRTDPARRAGSRGG
jgi:hypothetical protein